MYLEGQPHRPGSCQCHDCRVEAQPVSQHDVVLLAIAALIVVVGLAVLGLWLTRRSRRRPGSPLDLRRADSAQDQDAYDPQKATEEAEAMYWRNRPVP